jgi:hypothetical protein
MEPIAGVYTIQYIYNIMKEHNNDNLDHTYAEMFSK